MLDLTSKIASLPANLQYQLDLFSELSIPERISLRAEVLKKIVAPTANLRVISLALAYGISTKYRFVSQEQQLEIAGALIGGHLGYYSVEALKKTDQYIATPLEESLIAALGGLLGTNLLVANKGDIDENSAVLQTYNLYVLFSHLLPVALRTRYIQDFDKLYPIGVQ